MKSLSRSRGPGTSGTGGAVVDVVVGDVLVVDVAATAVVLVAGAMLVVVVVLEVDALDVEVLVSVTAPLAVVAAEALSAGVASESWFPAHEEANNSTAIDRVIDVRTPERYPTVPPLGASPAIVSHGN